MKTFQLPLEDVLFPYKSKDLENLACKVFLEKKNIIAQRHRRTPENDSESKNSLGCLASKTEGYRPTIVGIKISSNYIRI